MMDGSPQPRIPIYVRWSWQEKNMKPLYLNSTAPEYYADPNENEKHPNIILTHQKCFERVIRRNTGCHTCFYPSVSASAVTKFKETAYKLVKTSPSPIHQFDTSVPIEILHAYRGPMASRHIDNILHMQDLLLSFFPSPKYKLRSINTSNNTRWFYDQIDMVARAHVVITEHGAFQSNVIYMRNGSLLLDLQGDYGHGEFNNFKNLARMFGVFYSAVKTRHLTSHRSDAFNVSDAEIKEISEVVTQYIEEAPFMFNAVGSKAQTGRL